MVCAVCGEELTRFTSKHLRKHNITLEDYYNKYLKVDKGEGFCLVCGKPTKFINLSHGYTKYCSRQCSNNSKELNNKRKQTYQQTCFKKYGVNNVAKTENVKEKIKSVFLDKYGVEHPFQNKEVQEKYKQTCLEKYGVENPAQSSQVKEKYKQTCLEKYGVENAFQNKEIQEKYKQTCLERYGVENAFQHPKIKEKIKKTVLSKYGVENPNQSEAIKEKTRQTCLDKYGVENVFQNKEIQEKYKNTCLRKYSVSNARNSQEVDEKIRKKLRDSFKEKLNKLLTTLSLELVDEDYHGAHYRHKWKCTKCGTEFEQIWNTIQQGYLCPKCYPRIISNKSNGEEEIADFIKSLGFNIDRNNRTLISPLELDIVLHSKNLAIEYNGLYWHNEEKVPQSYHLNKSQLCAEKGYRLIQIFEDEWILKKDIVKSRLRHILGKTDGCFHIGARDCIVQEISTKQKNDFLQTYHLQGKDSSTIKIGAFYNNELVAVMTFSHGSLAKGVKKQDELVWELNRFCIHSNYVITGIAGKMLKYFKRKYKWSDIYSYADRRWSSGNLYEKLEFSLVGETSPNYWYWNGAQRIHRFKLRKRSDEPKDIPEYILRAKEGYVRVWDCGNLKFVMEHN